ncbi:MAG: hypothetical protein Q4G09_02415 [Clostridia bacterium]|nr:hypothetical protein [Clostridia bacterium]
MQELLQEQEIHGENQNSHNITGSSSNPFKIKITIDIKRPTTSGYTNDISMLVGGQTDGSIFANSEIDVKSGTIGRILGGSIGVDRTISGYPSNTFIGATKISVSGGTVGELYGASLGRQKSDVYFYGTIEINISGGTITQAIYGAGGGGTTGYHTSSTDPYKANYGYGVETYTKIKITGGYIDGNVYGGGYGYSEYLNYNTIANDGGALYGDSYIEISGGEVNGNIYGAGKGYSGYRQKTSLAQMIGETHIEISGTAIIKDVYGAGEGVRTTRI